MLNKKSVAIVLGICLFITSVIVIQRKAHNKATGASFTIGIIQTASHPALDAAREGFINELKKHMHEDVRFIIKNAEGSIVNAHVIAKSFHANKGIDGIFTIATTATQSMATIEKDRPIFVAATDPHLLGIMHPKTNVCGSSDIVDVQEEVRMMHQLLPNIKTVALLFNTGEINSVAMVEQMWTELQKIGVTPFKIGIVSEADIQSAVAMACRKADALLIPTDNMIASAISFVSEQALKAHKPFIASDNLWVKQGALAAQGVDYEENGRQAAQIALQVLIGGKKPHEIPIAQPNNERIFVNKKVLDALKLEVPKKLKSDIVFVGEETFGEKDD